MRERRGSEPKKKILFYDIETIGVNALKSDLGRVAVFGYKWGHEKKAKAIVARKKDLKAFDDRWLLKKASKLIVEADLVVGHYLTVFDRRFLQGRLLIQDLPPIPLTRARDTVFITRSVANFSSNRLGHLSKILRLPQQKQEKKGDSWPMWWIKTMAGDMKSLRDMAEYCKQDVLATEALYLRLAPFDNAHPRMVLDRTKCGLCGGDVEYRGFSYLGELRYRRYVCSACHKWGRERKAA